MSIQFNTIEYEISHGKLPRGRGSWAFAMTRRAPIDAVWFAPGYNSYAEAKKMAHEHFAAVAALNHYAGMGDTTLYVQP